MHSGDLIGNYVIVRKIGEGGMSLVYLAEDRAARSQVAIKQLRHELAFDQRLVERFAQGAQIMRELRHPHLARVLDYLEQDGQYFTVEEYLSGGSLADVLDHGEAHSEQQALGWCRDALQAVNYAHEHGIVHRDLKPSNLMLNDHGCVKVTDFGIARVFGGPRLTKTGREMGTPTYMSPEQIRSPLHVDHLTDVYSMGVVLYELLTGQVPFDGESDFDIKSQVVREPPVSPRQRNARLSPRVERVVLTAMAKDPVDRFGGCAEFARQIEQCLTTPGVERKTIDWRRVIIGTAISLILLPLAFPIFLVGLFAGALGTTGSESVWILLILCALTVIAPGFWVGRTTVGRGVPSAAAMGGMIGVTVPLALQWFGTLDEGLFVAVAVFTAEALPLACIGGWLGARSRSRARLRA